MRYSNRWPKQPPYKSSGTAHSSAVRRMRGGGVHNHPSTPVLKSQLTSTLLFVALLLSSASCLLSWPSTPPSEVLLYLSPPSSPPPLILKVHRASPPHNSQRSRLTRRALLYLHSYICSIYVSFHQMLSICFYRVVPQSHLCTLKSQHRHTSSGTPSSILGTILHFWACCRYCKLTSYASKHCTLHSVITSYCSFSLSAILATNLSNTLKR